MDTHHGYDDKEFKAYCDSENMAVGSLYGIVAWKAWQASRASPKECPVCDGWGTVSTGVDEAPSTLCKACDGNGSLQR